jgi:4-amino-4-deoxy-L-arabinose transferase-like glycosyltransferase
VPTSDNAGRSAARTKEHGTTAGSRNAPRPAPATPTPRSRFERRVLVVLCVLGAARIWFGAMALPMFADTDEQAHFDLVHKFARGDWPSEKFVRRDPEVREIAVYYHCPEFVARATEYPDGRYPPPMRERPEPERRAFVDAVRRLLNSQPNHEAHSPPVYYAIAGLWLDIGQSFGQSSYREVYWTRCLNALIFAALVALAYVFCQPYFGRNVALAVAALTAFFPNTVFFTVNSDLLSPLLVLATLMLLLRWYEKETPGFWFTAGVGALAAASVLVKLTNAAVLVAMAVVILLRLIRDRQPGKIVAASWPLLLASVLPLLGWGLRNREYFGDWTGTSSKVLQLTWLPKPPSEWLNHPIFTLAGLSEFLRQLTTNFFDGDSVFHGGPARSPVADTFLLATVALLPVIGLIAAFRQGRQEPRARLVAGMSALLIATFVGVLVYLSMRFDFNQCDYPSRKFPFFTSGRLIAGALVPLLALYARGLEALLGRWPILFAAAVVATVSMMVLAQEPYLKLALASRYNWFHLPRAADARSVR